MAKGTDMSDDNEKDTQLIDLIPKLLTYAGAIIGGTIVVGVCVVAILCAAAGAMG